MLAEDKTGFLYYPDGKVALCAAAASSYQNSHYAYDKNGTTLLAIDSLGIGFCDSSKRPAADLDNELMYSISLTEKGGLITRNRKIYKDWGWKHAKGQPTSPIEVRLNENLVFTYTDRFDMKLEFKCDDIKHVTDVSIKHKRKEPSYLDTAKRNHAGRLVPMVNAKSLRERTEDFNKQMQVKHNKVHPKSENLSDMVSHIVLGLEKKFNNVRTKMATSPSPGNTWKGNALSTTLGELPKISMAGTETGVITGFGESLYSDQTADTLKQTSTSTPGHLLNMNGTWKNDTDVRNALVEMSPVLRRTNVLKCNSGRYSNMLVVNPDNVSFKNPTGMLTNKGLPLEGMRWTTLKEQLAEGGSSDSTIRVALVGREGEPRFGVCQRILELAKLQLEGTPDALKFRLLRVEVGENSDILQQLAIKYLPTFVAWSGGKMIYSGQMGGKQFITRTPTNLKVLLIEPNPKFQISIEKMLKKCGYDSFLCLSVGDAIERIRKMGQDSSGDQNAQIFDMVLLSESVLGDSVNLSVLKGKLSAYIDSRRTIVTTIISVLGKEGKEAAKAYSWNENCVSEDVDKLPGSMSKLIHYMIQMPLKVQSILEVAKAVQVPTEEFNFGLTPVNFISRIKGIAEKATQLSKNQSELMNLTVNDVSLQGTKLCK